jgi:hypothetical protein
MVHDNCESIILSFLLHVANKHHVASCALFSSKLLSIRSAQVLIEIFASRLICKWQSPVIQAYTVQSFGVNSLGPIRKFHSHTTVIKLTSVYIQRCKSTEVCQSGNVFILLRFSNFFILLSIVIMLLSLLLQDFTILL